MGMLKERRSFPATSVHKNICDLGTQRPGAHRVHHPGTSYTSSEYWEFSRVWASLQVLMDVGLDWIGNCLEAPPVARVISCKDSCGLVTEAPGAVVWEHTWPNISDTETGSTLFAVPDSSSLEENKMP